MRHSLKALTIRQPWAWLIVSGQKDIDVNADSRADVATVKVATRRCCRGTRVDHTHFPVPGHAQCVVIVP